MKTTLQIIFYSMYGHTYKMTEAVAKGARSVPDVHVDIFRIAELVPEDMLVKSGAKEAQKSFEHIPVITPSDLSLADGFIFGTPTRFGNICSQMRHFISQLHHPWGRESLVGKVGSVFTSANNDSQMTLTNFHTSLFHLGMIIAGVPVLAQSNAENHPILSPIVNKHNPSENELAIASYLGKHVAEITRQFKQGKHSLAWENARSA